MPLLNLPRSTSEKTALVKWVVQGSRLCGFDFWIIFLNHDDVDTWYIGTGMRWNHQAILLLITALATVGSFWKAPYPQELLLQHVPTLVGLIAIAVVCERYRPSPTAVCCCLGFLWLHLIGARWIYSFVPYDDWTEYLLGFRLSDRFGWQRNHYDRLVHFASGLLGVPPLAEFLRTRVAVQPVAAAWLAVTCVMAIGAVYEIVEWQIAMLFAPEYAESYNGQQGDVWDAQKDLAMALGGALLAVPWVARRKV